jgi:hypothetical protein
MHPGDLTGPYLYHYRRQTFSKPHIVLERGAEGRAFLHTCNTNKQGDALVLLLLITRCMQPILAEVHLLSMACFVAAVWAFEKVSCKAVPGLRILYF